MNKPNPNPALQENVNQSNNNSTKPAYYGKRHQPQPPTISSFMSHFDKSLFIDDNNASTKSPSEPQENDDPANLIQSSQLKVYTNPSAYNPKEFNTSPKAARFFVIKSYSEDDVHRSIKYNIWCSTEHGNRRLDAAYFRGDGQVPVYLFFSVNGSGHFCGMAEMISRVDYNKKTDVWSQDKWRGCFQVKWIYVKDVPNSILRTIKLENNDNKPVTNSRDTQEIPFEKGKQVLKIFHSFNYTSSILDDFDHYERKQVESLGYKTRGSYNSNEASNSTDLNNNNNNDNNDDVNQNSVFKSEQEEKSLVPSSSSSSSSSSTSSTISSGSNTNNASNSTTTASSSTTSSPVVSSAISATSSLSADETNKIKQ